jgi:hypothetical protein
MRGRRSAPSLPKTAITNRRSVMDTGSTGSRPARTSGLQPKPKRPLRDANLSRTVCFRQGLWTEGLRTPPGQECSNGSLILLAVVLWRTFFGKDSRAIKDADCSNETPESKDIALSRGHREMRQAGGLHPVAKAANRPAFSVASEKQSCNDNQTQRGRNGFWRRRFLQRECCTVSGLPEIVKTFRRRANRGNRLDVRAILSV